MRGNNTAKAYEFESFTLNRKKQLLDPAGEIIALPPRAVELLILLVERRGEIVDKDFLLKTLWTETFVEEANLTQYIYLLRKSLGKTSDDAQFIQTFPKRGYKFLPNVLVSFEEQPKHSEPNEIINEKIHSVEKTEPEELPIYINNETKNSPNSYSSVSQSSAVASAFAFSRYKIEGIVFAVLLCTGLIIYGLTRAENAASLSLPNAKTIAVLPFKSIGAEHDDQLLGMGMTDAIITRLGKTNSIQVAPTDAVRRYESADEDWLAAGRELNVETVLTGNIQKVENRLRVTVQLLRVADESLLWTEQFDENFTDIFAVQDVISQKLAGALALRLSDEERKQLTAKYTDNVEAYETYLKCRYYWGKRTPEWVQKSIPCFEEALRLDPKFALAYAGLADAYAVSASGLPFKERFPKAKTAALKALALDETLAEAHTSLAFLLYKADWNWAESEKHFRRAIQLNPNYALAHHWFGEFLGLRGRFDEGVAELNKAATLDPLSLSIKSDLGRLYYRARNYDEAIILSQKTLELDPNFTNAWNTLTLAYEQKGMFDESVAADLRSIKEGGVSPSEIEKLVGISKASDWGGYWSERFAFAQKYAGAQNLNYSLAEMSLRAGEKQTALKYLTESIRAHDDGALFFKTDPLLDSLRSAPEFKELLQKAENTVGSKTPAE